MKREIKFYVPASETIPTELRLYAGDKYVTYERIQSGFRFEILTDDEDEALAIAKDIAEIMIRDHSEPQHGISWRTISFSIVAQEERYRIGTLVDWTYRVRDSY